MGGSEDRPVSMTLMCAASSPKHSSRESKPELAPNTEKCGVQVCAGMSSASGGDLEWEAQQLFAVQAPRMGRPSACRLPMRASRALILATTLKLGARIRLCALRSRPWRL